MRLICNKPDNGTPCETVRISDFEWKRVSRLREPGHALYRCTRCFRISDKKKDRKPD